MAVTSLRHASLLGKIPHHLVLCASYLLVEPLRDRWWCGGAAGEPPGEPGQLKHSSMCPATFGWVLRHRLANSCWAARRPTPCSGSGEGASPP